LYDLWDPPDRLAYFTSREQRFQTLNGKVSLVRKGWSQERGKGVEERMEYAWHNWCGFRGQENGKDLSSLKLDNVVLNIQSARDRVRKHALPSDVEVTAGGHRMGVLDRFQRLE
jgi:hypothetical protein